MAAAVASALFEQSAGQSVAFVVQDPARDEIVGSTRYLNIDAANRRVEIGYTWIAASAQRSVINSACKRLWLGHAFDTLDAVAVELRTHWHNHRSRAAIERLGARMDGVLRQHRIMDDGSFRDTVVYPILDREWPAVRRQLDFRLEA